jgi:hypothetical protein
MKILPAFTEAHWKPLPSPTIQFRGGSQVFPAALGASMRTDRKISPELFKMESGRNQTKT